VRAMRGLGGCSLVERRPRFALDYRTARNITHDYDQAILGEGISTLFAMPVVTNNETWGVIYCGSWGKSRIAPVITAALDVAEELSGELRIREEARRHMSGPADAAAEAMPVDVRESLRAAFADLRNITASVDDAELRARLNRVEGQLASLANRDFGSTAAGAKLSPREVDVLAQVALGATNAAVGAALQLKETTVKSYLQSAMQKLEVATRHAAVVAARRRGLLP